MSGTAAATGSASCRFAHYFVECGVDTETGLEPDDGAGTWSTNTPQTNPFKLLNTHPRTRFMSFKTCNVGLVCVEVTSI